MSRLTRVGITQGDHNGVGPEVALKALADDTILEIMTPVVFADMRIVERAMKELSVELPRLRKVVSASEAEDGAVNIVDLRLADCTVEAGHPTPVSGAGAVAALECAVAALQDGSIDALVTAPICKEAVQSDSFHFPGHTEYLGSKAGEEYEPQMILFDEHLRVALVTTHLPVADIAAALTSEKIQKSIESFSKTLKQDFNIVRPKIAVLSLNPHCGDGGLLGHEEETVIKPALELCAESGVLAFGPYAADGFFGSGAYRRFDGVLAMYHDQGLAPFKTIAGEYGVNFTAGLPFVRTSPDHGTAYDIAWRGEADASSMRNAIYKAIDIWRDRARYMRSASNPLRRQSADRVPRPERGPRPDRPTKSTAPARVPQAAQQNTDAAKNEPDQTETEKTDQTK